MRVRAVVAYDGTRFHGFQRQAASHGLTVQGELEHALEKIVSQAITVLGAGRTDSGVHARGQVIAFDIEWRHPEDDLLRALNANLPREIAVLHLVEDTADFHPRYQAHSREYCYTIYSARLRHPLYRLHALHVKEALDVEAMHTAAQCLLGEHDFAAFGQPTSGESTVRFMHRLKVDGKMPWVRIDLVANGFLYRMVRSIVGTLIAVGRGQMTCERFVEILESCDRSQAGVTVAAHGLCLMKVNY